MIEPLPLAGVGTESLALSRSYFTATALVLTV